MKDKDKTKEQLLYELVKLRQQISELKISLMRQKTKEDMSKKLEEMKELIMSSISERVVYLDKEHKIIWANKATCELVGLKHSKLIGCYCYDILFKRNELCEGCHIGKVFKSGKFQRDEIVTPDGRIWAVRGYPVKGKKGDIVGAIAIILDITKQKKADEELKEKEEYFQALIENSSDAITVLNADGTIRYESKALERMLGYKQEERVSKSSLELLHPDDIQRAKKLLAQLIRKPGSNIRGEASYKHKDGSWHTLEMIGSNFINNPAINGIVINSRDITDRKRAEEKIKTSLEEKNAMLREIHHRVKNNMQIILSLLRLQSRHFKDENMIEMFKVSQNRIKSMALIHESLYRSKDLASIDFSDYTKMMTTHLLAMYGIVMSTINLKVDIEDVYLDINRAIPCGLIISELVSNSLKHAFPKGRKGEIIVKMHSDKKGKHTLIIRDTGVGFPEGLDIHETETLGMQLVTDLVKQLKGTIKLDREDGTTFKITF